MALAFLVFCQDALAGQTEAGHAAPIIEEVCLCNR
jgi:hypothetical protein